MIKRKTLLVPFWMLLLIGGCSAPAAMETKTATRMPLYPDASFCVLSDTHLYDTRLGTEGSAFENYLENDRKLLKESMDILESAIGSIASEKCGFVLVTGDLTKDGEKICHQKAAEYFERLRTSGKKVYVIPGNHDVLNGQAERYSGGNTEPVANVTPEQFASIYSNCGYGDALFRDKDSLSYVAEPVGGLWLIALDTCRWRENLPGHEAVVGGKLYRPTLEWLKEMFRKAENAGKAVIVIQHHGILEHFPSQKKYYGEYVIDQNDDLSALYASFHTRIVFTGHFHAQNIAFRDFGNHHFLYDIETGSLVTYPCPYRKVEIDSRTQCMTVRRGEVSRITGKDEGFQAYAREFLLNGIARMSGSALIKMGLPQKDSEILAPQIASAFCAQYTGEKSNRPVEVLDISRVGWFSGFIASFRRDLLEGLWLERPGIDDNRLTIELTSGKSFPPESR